MYDNFQDVQKLTVMSFACVSVVVIPERERARESTDGTMCLFMFYRQPVVSWLVGWISVTGFR